MNRDRTTPRLEMAGQRAVLSGSEFLTGQEAVLQARIDEIEQELAGLAGTPDDVETAEQHALDGLRVLADWLFPPAAPVPVPPQPTIPKEEPAWDAGASTKGKSHRRVHVLVGALLAVAAVVTVFLLQGLPWLTGTDLTPTTTPALSARATSPAAPTAVARATRTRPEPAATPQLSATAIAPVILQPQIRGEGTAEAEAVQIMGISPTVRLDLSLTVMTETIDLVDGMPVLRYALPRHRAGVHRASAPFGATGVTVVAIPATEATAGLWQTRPGDHLVGCNDDGTCHGYRIVAAESWPLDRVRHLVEACAERSECTWPEGSGVWLYAIRETDAWVIQARWQEEEKWHKD